MPAAPPLTLARDLAGSLRLGAVAASPVGVAPAGAALLAEIEEVCASLRARHAGKAPGSIDGLAPARDLYRAFRIDPTRTRPSSEALLRRVLQDKPLPRILNAVDLCNLCALRFLLPIGLYDLASIRGAVVARRGLPDESYPGIRKEAVHLEGRPVLADQEGPFGNPTSDSLRTAVSERTAALWMVIFAPAAYPAERLRLHAETARAGMAIHLASAAGRVAAEISLLPEE